MITLTDTAAVKVKELLDAEGEPELALRVAVRPGGCSGFSYEMFFDGDVASRRRAGRLRRRQGRRRPGDAQLLVGATLDYKDGLQEAGFTINNPNASAPAAAARASADAGRPGLGGPGARQRGGRSRPPKSESNLATSVPLASATNSTGSKFNE